MSSTNPTAATLSYCKWHESCVRFWTNLNYKHSLYGVAWAQRLSNVLRFALAALVRCGNVLIQCHRGKHLHCVLGNVAYAQSCCCMLRGADLVHTVVQSANGECKWSCIDTVAVEGTSVT